MRSQSAAKALIFLCALLFLSACGGGGSSSSDTATTPAANSGPAITGTVSAPGGSVAFNRPTGLRLMLAEFFGRAAHAALTGLNPVSGAAVQLIEIDSSGAQVGAVLASATTNSSGTYTLTAPAGFIPAAKFVIRVTGTGSNRLDALVTGTTVNVDPGTDATRALVIDAVTSNGSTLSAASVTEILEIQRTVEDIVKEKEVDPASLSATALSAALKAATLNNEETNNSVRSIASQGVITGTVTGSGPLENITIIVRDFGNWVTRAITTTDALGQYTVNVPPGDYIVGALNQTATITGASEWWTSTGGAVKQLSAEKVTVVDTTPVTKDFELGAGGRISGTVTAETGGAPLPGISIKVRDFLNNQSVANVKTAEDGTYRINLAPGLYYLIAENRTLQPYATEIYNLTLNGGINFGQATRLEVGAGGVITADISLQAGRMISGLVSDPTTGPAPGIRVRFDDAEDGEHATVQRTNKIGEYRLWLRPGKYTVLARGQTAVDVDVTSADQIRNFSAAVSELKMVLKDGAGNPVSQAKAHLRRGVSGIPTNTDGSVISKEASNSDGTVSMYSLVAETDALLEIKMDNGQMIGSSIYNGRTRLLPGAPPSGVDLVPSGDPINLASISDLGTVTLPAGGVLSGKVTVGGVSRGGVRVQVRHGGRGGSARFVNTSTQLDGTYFISLPATTLTSPYTRVCAFIIGSLPGCPNTASVPGSGNGSGFAFVDNVAITAGATRTVDFDFLP